jgi:hypothetical protein
MDDPPQAPFPRRPSRRPNFFARFGGEQHGAGGGGNTLHSMRL